MRNLITLLLFTAAMSVPVFAQVENDLIFSGCRVKERTLTETVVPCTLNGKLVELRFPVNEFWFGSQCAVVESTFSTWEVAHGKVYDPPFTLQAADRWIFNRSPYSLCEMALHQSTQRSCVTGRAELPHEDLDRWLRCPAQNIK